ncbi:unnamed protein product [Sordaria macrospora k-hell]|uniref:WGS project CABT00000000 data, contig 2.60 n=1 Tax=Sordaria macrospora (strain ATCC MYA-333 / DSM 997 / K(L3346) / K-hell) TaxID=771870 RepID=F7WAE5_SORMK|nr:uncharacterized protein SMAC_08624 [Sordaria macrospora k-hell]CCC14180.1 unnamed protein product [Sordaria macrospora k-hell]
MAPPRKPEDYTLRVTAGPTYDLSTHVEVPINSSRLTHIESLEGMDIDLNVRIQNYRGLPRGSNETSPYFEREPHRYNKDQYSIGLQFTPKAPSHGNSKAKVNGSGNGNRDENGSAATEASEGRGSMVNNEKDVKEEGEAETDQEGHQPQGIPASDLQFGNDFDHPIRNYLPPGVNTAMNILKWWIDPGLEGDAYADEPFLYGPALSSFNSVRVGAGEHDEEGGCGLWVEEGASSSESESESEDESGEDDKKAATAKAKSSDNGTNDNSNNNTSMQEVLKGSWVGNDAKKRQKWALKEDSKKKWVWEYGRTYSVDFYNPYIDFGKCELKLPGFGVNVLRYWDGETGLRYVLRNRLTKKPYLVILFTLYPNDMVNEDGTLKPEALKATARASGGGKNETDGAKATSTDAHASGNGAAKKDGDKDGFDEDKAMEEARGKLEGVKLGDGPTGGSGGDDDVD